MNGCSSPGIRPLGSLSWADAVLVIMHMSVTMVIDAMAFIGFTGALRCQERPTQ